MTADQAKWQAKYWKKFKKDKETLKKLIGEHCVNQELKDYARKLLFLYSK